MATIIKCPEVLVAQGRSEHGVIWHVAEQMASHPIMVQEGSDDWAAVQWLVKIGAASQDADFYSLVISLKEVAAFLAAVLGKSR